MRLQFETPINPDEGRRRMAEIRSMLADRCVASRRDLTQLDNACTACTGVTVVVRCELVW